MTDKTPVFLLDFQKVPYERASLYYVEEKMIDGSNQENFQIFLIYRNIHIEQCQKFDFFLLRFPTSTSVHYYFLSATPHPYLYTLNSWHLASIQLCFRKFFKWQVSFPNSFS